MSDEQDPLEAFGGADIDRGGLGDNDVVGVDFADFVSDSPAAQPDHQGLDLVCEIPVTLTAELGETQITIKELLSFGPGSVVELDRLAGEPADLLVNGVLVGRGDVVVINENYGLRITELISSEERLRRLAD